MSLYNERGIYEILNKITDKRYIGYCTVSFGDRRDTHFSCLRGGYHFNQKLQEDFNRFGIDAFEFNIVEIIDSNDVDVYKEREVYYISILKSDVDGYNVCHGGDTRIRPSENKIRDMATLNRKLNTGKIVSESTIESMKLARARTMARNHGKNGSTILTKDDVAAIKKRLMRGEGVNEIAREYNVSFGCISQINVGKNWKSVIVPGWEDYISSKQY